MDDETADTLKSWVQKAEEDFEAARRLMEDSELCLAGAIGFHSQQCVEKYLKALLIQAGVDFPKVHDIETIVGLMPAGIRPELAPEDQRKLTDYATILRYPGGYEPPTRSDAVRAVELARKVREAARRRLGL